jgi:hypothetical protein
MGLAVRSKSSPHLVTVGFLSHFFLLMLVSVSASQFTAISHAAMQSGYLLS